MRWTMLLTVVGCADRLHLPDPPGADDEVRVEASRVVLNEILADPGKGDPSCDGVASATADELLELVNPSTVEIDLSGGTISDALKVRHTFPAGTVLPPGGVLVVFGGGDPQACAGVPATVLLQTASTGSLGLNNDGDRALVVAPDGEILGEHAWGREGNADQSLVRSPEGSEDGVWVQHTTVSDTPWSPGTAADGAPFAADPPAACSDTVCAACDAAGFWGPTVDLSGDELREVLHALTASQTCDDYSVATAFLFLELDGADGDVACVYTGRVTDVDGAKPDSNDMNTEHSWPQSQGAAAVPARCDLHHLYPTDAHTNGVRGNLPFGEVVTDTEPLDGGSRVGRSSTGSLVFEPRDDHKGNLARSMVYFAMRYDHDLPDAELARYRAWSSADPVDATEIARTNAIALEQGVANPYVLCPGLIDR